MTSSRARRAGRDGRLRIDDLARESGIASGTIRFYQREGLIRPPEREGRVAWYGAGHVVRLARIRALQSQGLPLALVRDLLEREDAGEDVSSWLRLDRAVFAAPHPGEPVPASAVTALGFGPEALEKLVAAGTLQRDGDGTIRDPSGLLDLVREMLDAGVPAATIAAGAGVIGEHVRALVDATADLGWEVFAAERERIASDEPVADAVLAKLETLRRLAERSVTTLFRRMLDDAVRERGEGFATELAERRRAR